MEKGNFEQEFKKWVEQVCDLITGLHVTSLDHTEEKAKKSFMLGFTPEQYVRSNMRRNEERR